jgi:DNA-binding HxlR family transcriptional regulator
MPAPKKVEDDEILEVFFDSDDRVLTTAEIADELPISRRGLLDRLNQLEEEGRVKKKRVGGRNIVWWPTEMAWMGR